MLFIHLLGLNGTIVQGDLCHMLPHSPTFKFFRASHLGELLETAMLGLHFFSIAE